MSVLGILYWLSRIIAIGAIIHVVLDNRQPAKTMAWALVIYFIPIFGVIAYLFFGVNYRKRPTVQAATLSYFTGVADGTRFAADADARFGDLAVVD